MSLNYAKRLAVDTGGHDLQEFTIPYVAIQTDISENNTVSSVVTLNDNTSSIEIHATGTGAVAKWIATTNTNPSVISAATTANYDIAIPPNYFRRLTVPQESIGVPSIVGINKQAGGYLRLAVKSVGVGSVATIQY